MSKIVLALKNHLDKNKQNDFAVWVNNALNSNHRCALLIYCIAIDLKYGAVGQKVYTSIFNSINYSLGKSLSEMFNDEKDRFHDFSSYQSDGDKKYTSIVTKRNFRNKLRNDDHNMSDEFDRVLKKLDYGEIDLDLFFGSVKNTPYWVYSTEDIDNFLNNFNNPLHHIDELAGVSQVVGSSNIPFYRIDYPRELEIDFYQPTALDAKWNSDSCCFISYRKYDNFGRTRSRNEHRIRERVHGTVDETIKCSVTFLGKTTKCPKNFSSILKEAKARV